MAFCESDAFCRSVTRKHWPGRPHYRDVKHVNARTARHLGHIDIITAGPPCQPVSRAGNRKGSTDDRWLWGETLRVFGELRPRYAIMENPTDLFSNNGGREARFIFGQLADLGYDAQWDPVPACAVGADHVRERQWIVAYTRCGGGEKFRLPKLEWVESESRRFTDRRRAVWQFKHSPRLEGEPVQTERRVGRVAHGVSRRVDRLRTLGNAIVPQIAEVIGRAILEVENER